MLNRDFHLDLAMAWVGYLTEFNFSSYAARVQGYGSIVANEWFAGKCSCS